jgi:FAD/FMN-containing dehydrogenase
MAESLPDRLWKEYSLAFEEFDDLTLARWLAQTLSQLQGRTWRFSHPLIGSYRLAAELAHRRQIWLKRLANVPSGFAPAPCCRAPALPLFSRDILQSGLVCQHCSETLVPFEDLPADLRPPVQRWVDDYASVHAVAHWDDPQRKSVPDYDQACDDAAAKAETLLAYAANNLLPRFLDHYAAILWEDQDECLEVLPEDIVLS